MNSIKLAHQIHPVKVAPESDLTIAQPITFSSMASALDFCAMEPDLSVELWATQYADEPRIPLPEAFRRTRDLNRSILDLKAFKKPRKLALIADLLARLAESSTADYLIYSNVDIALQPFFYSTVAALIRRGHDAFAINHRTIPAHYTTPDQLPQMYAEIGEKHPGWDCFVFSRALYDRFDLGETIIGSDWFGRNLISNLGCLARQFAIFETLQLTFHIGDSRPWQNDDFADYKAHNRDECRRFLTRFDALYGPLDRTVLPGRFFRQLERGL